MTTRVFACRACRQYIDAGGRWCHSKLEIPGIIETGQAVNVPQVLTATEYWGLPTGEWLADLLPLTRVFLQKHEAHGIVFGVPADDQIYDYGTHEFLDGHDSGPGEPHDISLCTMIVEKNCRNWCDVEAYMSTRPAPVWWWGQPEIMDVAEHRFGLLPAKR